VQDVNWCTVGATNGLDFPGRGNKKKVKSPGRGTRGLQALILARRGKNFERRATGTSRAPKGKSSEEGDSFLSRVGGPRKQNNRRRKKMKRHGFKTKRNWERSADKNHGKGSHSGGLMGGSE